MKKITAILLILIPFFHAMGQQNTLLLHSFFKDCLLDNSEKNSSVGSSFFPKFESETGVNSRLKDSSLQYYDVTETLFKKHLFEVKGQNYYLTISPVLDLAKGKDLSDTSERKLFQNTRGFYIEGDLFKNFSFSTSLFENQSRFAQYESAYYSSVGELYPNASEGYTTQNAVIPGSGRTKPFKETGFDYAYAIGNIVYKPHRSILLSAGNTSHFIGDGHRSMLLSDNSAPAPFFRSTFQLSPKWKFDYLRMRLVNLLRKPASSSVESYYETKGYSVNYLSYLPNPKLCISFFEGVVWSRGDSILSKKVHPLYYNPIPLVANLSLSEKEIYSIIGLNLSYSLVPKHRFYGQFALGNLDAKQVAYQIGYRGYNYFGWKNFMVQLEYNSVSKNMYSSSNPRLNYSHYNLPLSHSKGSSFQEFILRSNYERKRFYVDIKSIVYLVKDYSSLDLLAVQKIVTRETGSIFLQKMELGYRFNKKMNLTIFSSLQFRTEMFSEKQHSNQIFIGIRTGITNHYNDF